jgi:hypothetical protein
MTLIKNKTNIFVAIFLLAFSQIVPVSAQKRILNPRLSETLEIQTGVLVSEVRIETAKPHYDAGENVAINGWGFGKLEQVSLSVERVDAYEQANELLSGWTVTADKNGNISGEWVVPYEGQFVIKAQGVDSGAQSESTVDTWDDPIVLTGNPSCATLNASSNPAFAHITTDYGFKLDANPPTGNYPFTTGGIRSLTGGAPAEPGNTLSYTRIFDWKFNWTSTRSISAVIVKAGTKSNVYTYNPAAFGGQHLVTATGQDISHVEFCYGPAAAKITIIKDAQPNSTQDFSFKAWGQVNQDFNLVDNGVVGPDRIAFSNLTKFGSGNRVTVMEDASAPYSLTSITCTSNGTGTENNTINVPVRFATIQLEPGEAVVCTFVNSITTAANVRLGGRVTDAVGTPVSRASVTVQNLSNGETQTVATNSFGFYSFDGLPSGESYVVTVSHRRYTFSNGSQIFTLSDAVENLDFIADSQ